MGLRVGDRAGRHSVFTFTHRSVRLETIMSMLAFAECIPAASQPLCRAQVFFSASALIVSKGYRAQETLQIP